MTKRSLCVVMLMLSCGSQSDPMPDADTLTDAGHDAGRACTPNPSTGSLPCDVATVLQDKCLTCHSNPPVDNAPFSFVTYADTIAPFQLADGGTEPMWMEMAYVIYPDAIPHMPYGDAPALTVDEVQTLQGWFAACAPAGDECANDGGTPLDAGTVDAGPQVDAGTPHDAGSPPKADGGSSGPPGGGPPPY